MVCRVARAYALAPHVVAAWPLGYYRLVRNELIESWKPPPKADDDDIREL